MKKRILTLVLTAVCLVVLLGGYFLNRQQQALSDKLIRLHVVAHSDEAEDQAIKLKVRDAVLQETERILDGQQIPKLPCWPSWMKLKRRPMPAWILRASRNARLSPWAGTVSHQRV